MFRPLLFLNPRIPSVAGGAGKKSKGLVTANNRCDQEMGYPELDLFGFRNSSPVCVVTYKEPGPHFRF